MRESQPACRPVSAHRLAAIALMLCGLSASTLPAQIRGRPARRAPDASWWFSGGAAAVVLNTIADGATRSTWTFGTDPRWQMRGTLEKALDEATTIGVSAGYGVIDLTLVPFTAAAGSAPPAPVVATCDTTCAAQTQLWSLMGQFRSGGGAGFYTLFEAAGGVTAFRGMQQRDSGTPLGPDKGQVDLTGTLGAGFAYGLSSSLHVSLVQEFGMGWHATADLPDGVGRTWRARTTRASLRFGFGARR